MPFKYKHTSLYSDENFYINLKILMLRQSIKMKVVLFEFFTHMYIAKERRKYATPTLSQLIATENGGPFQKRTFGS